MASARPRLRAALIAIRLGLTRILRGLLRALLLFLSELRDQAYLVLLIAVGVGLIVRELLPGAAWGAGMVVFGTLTLFLRGGKPVE